MSLPLDLQPSAARTYAVPVPTSGIVTSPVMVAPKASADVLDYTLDFTEFLSGTSDALTFVAVRPSSDQNTASTVSANWAVINGSKVTILLTSGQPYSVTITNVEVSTVQGRLLTVPIQIQITGATKALTAKAFPYNTTENGGVLMTESATVPSGYSSNGGVIMTGVVMPPVGTPSFATVTAKTYAGDGSNLSVTAKNTTQTIAQWIASLASGSNENGETGSGIASITASQDTVTVGQPSLVTLTAHLTDGTTSTTTFKVPAGAQGEKGIGLSGSDGVSIESITATQDQVITGKASTVTLATELSNGTTSNTTFSVPAGMAGQDGIGLDTIEMSSGSLTPGVATTVTVTINKTDGSSQQTTFAVPPGAPGSGGDINADDIVSILGYIPAEPSKYLALAPSSASALQSIIAPDDSKFGSTYSFALQDNYGNALNIGCVSANAVNWFGVYSPAGHSTGLRLADFMGNVAGIAGHGLGDGTTDLYTAWYGMDAAYGEGGLRWINRDGSGHYWKISASNLTNTSGWLALTAGTRDAAAWQTSPLVSFDPDNNVAHFTKEPIVTSYTACAFADLPSSPADWQRIVVTDKSINGGTAGIMVMWNPNTRTWTGLSGETIA